MGGPPFLEPLADLLHVKALRDSPAVLALRALGEGGWRTQADLFSLGKVDDERCQACLDGPGTFTHRCVGCSARATARHEFIEKSKANREVVEKAQRDANKDKPLYKHGFATRPKRTRKPKPQFRFIGVWDIGELFIGYAYTDGSLRRRGGKDDIRGGWSCVIVDARGNLLYGMYGPNPHPFPTAFNSELLAVVMLLRRATAPLVVHTDNQANEGPPRAAMPLLTCGGTSGFVWRQ